MCVFVVNLLGKEIVIFRRKFCVLEEKNFFMHTYIHTYIQYIHIHI